MQVLFAAAARLASGTKLQRSAQRKCSEWQCWGCRRTVELLVDLDHPLDHVVLLRLLVLHEPDQQRRHQENHRPEVKELGQRADVVGLQRQEAGEGDEVPGGLPDRVGGRGVALVLLLQRAQRGRQERQQADVSALESPLSNGKRPAGSECPAAFGQRGRTCSMVSAQPSTAMSWVAQRKNIQKNRA